jgi:hypothetical protein
VEYVDANGAVLDRVVPFDPLGMTAGNGGPGSFALFDAAGLLWMLSFDGSTGASFVEPFLNISGGGYTVANCQGAPAYVARNLVADNVTFRYSFDPLVRVFPATPPQTYNVQSQPGMFGGCSNTPGTFTGYPLADTLPVLAILPPAVQYVAPIKARWVP